MFCVSLFISIHTLCPREIDALPSLVYVWAVDRKNVKKSIEQPCTFDSERYCCTSGRHKFVKQFCKPYVQSSECSRKWRRMVLMGMLLGEGQNCASRAHAVDSVFNLGKRETEMIREAERCDVSSMKYVFDKSLFERGSFVVDMSRKCLLSSNPTSQAD